MDHHEAVGRGEAADLGAVGSEELAGSRDVAALAEPLPGFLQPRVWKAFPQLLGMADQLLDPFEGFRGERVLVVDFRRAERRE